MTQSYPRRASHPPLQRLRQSGLALPPGPGLPADPAVGDTPGDKSFVSTVSAHDPQCANNSRPAGSREGDVAAVRRPDREARVRMSGSRQVPRPPLRRSPRRGHKYVGARALVHECGFSLEDDAPRVGRPVRHSVAAAARHQLHIRSLGGDRPDRGGPDPQRERQPASRAPGRITGRGIPGNRQFPFAVRLPDLGEVSRSPNLRIEGQCVSIGREDGVVGPLVLDQEPAPAAVAPHDIEPVRSVRIAPVLVAENDQAAGRRKRRLQVPPRPPTPAAPAGDASQLPGPRAARIDSPDRPRADLLRTPERRNRTHEGDRSVPPRKRRLSDRHRGAKAHGACHERGHDLPPDRSPHGWHTEPTKSARTGSRRWTISWNRSTTS
jgi:hypothetical protein